jgi:hypothetical protein
MSCVVKIKGEEEHSASEANQEHRKQNTLVKKGGGISDTILAVVN